MAQYQVPDPEELMECPYDRVHMVRAKRFQYHLMKCRKNYTGKDFVTCPFNAKHEMPKPELRHHLANCPDRALMDPEREFDNRDEGDIIKGCTDTPVYENIDIPASEDWESEVTGQTYGPLQDKTYYSRVQFKTMDRTILGKDQRKIVVDERLTPSQKIYELNQYRNGDMDDDLRLPKTSSMAARPMQPQVQPREQPHSSVFAYSVGAGRGRGRGVGSVPNDPVDHTVNAVPYGRGMGGVYGVGRGMMMGSDVNGVGQMGRGGIGRGIVGNGPNTLAPPPGFCVPNINHQQELFNGFH